MVWASVSRQYLAGFQARLRPLKGLYKHWSIQLHDWGRVPPNWTPSASRWHNERWDHHMENRRRSPSKIHLSHWRVLPQRSNIQTLLGLAGESDHYGHLDEPCQYIYRWKDLGLATWGQAKIPHKGPPARKEVTGQRDRCDWWNCSRQYVHVEWQHLLCWDWGRTDL